MIAGSATIPSFGWIPRDEAVGLASRHLGLVMGHESDSLRVAGGLIEEHADLDAILATARTAPSFPCPDPEPDPQQPEVRIGIAYDGAFCFYYQDNLDRLRHAGAELVFFSPISDPLPDVDGIYFGGGYPELHLPALASSPVTRDLGKKVEEGLPVYAECGGLMYLTREIGADTTFRMAGILPADAMMTKKIQALGYVKGETRLASTPLSAGSTITGHEFHYSRVLPDRDARYVIQLHRGKGIDAGKDGLVCGPALGSYTHAWFTPRMAQDIIAACRQYSLG
jgi:cobyrinic acid a,c-diamide synthase